MQNFLRNGRQKFWKNFSFSVSPFQALLPVLIKSQAGHLSADFLLAQYLGNTFKVFLGQTHSITHPVLGLKHKWIPFLSISDHFVSLPNMIEFGAF